MPANINNLKITINSIIACKKDCDFIANSSPDGIIPRCMFLENLDSSSIGCIVVGQNPGKSKPPERSYYTNKIVNQEIIQEYWRENISNKPDEFYQRVRSFINSLGISSIYWTEVAKCENKTFVPMEKQDAYDDVLRECAKKHLSIELSQLPNDWPLFAIGKKAFKICSELFTDRLIIGLPHATGENVRFKFDKINKNDAAKKQILNIMRKKLDATSGNL